MITELFERKEIEVDVWIAADDEVLVSADNSAYREIDAQVYADRLQEVVKQHTANGQKLYARSYDGSVPYLFIKRMETDEEYEKRLLKDKEWAKMCEDNWIKHILENAEEFGYDVVLTKRET